jgi:hypothetical protein
MEAKQRKGKTPKKRKIRIGIVEIKRRTLKSSHTSILTHTRVRINKKKIAKKALFFGFLEESPKAFWKNRRRRFWKNRRRRFWSIPRIPTI